MIKSKIKNRELKDLPREAKDIIVNYITGEIDYIKAHNKLLVFNIYLTEEKELLDY